MDYLVHIIRY